MLGKKLLDKALKIVNQRGNNYGDINKAHEDIAKGWSVILGVNITKEQVSLCMDWLKTVRLKSNPNHYDSLVDKVGYAITYSETIKGNKKWQIFIL